jgi:hypothetical protein
VKGELLLINIGSTSTGGRVLSVKADLAKIQLTSPACTEIGEKVALSRRIEKHWRLVGEDYVWSAVKGTYPSSQVGEVFNGEQCWRLTRLRIELYFWYTNFGIPSLFCNPVLNGGFFVRKIVGNSSCDGSYRHRVLVWNLDRNLAISCSLSHHLAKISSRSFRLLQPCHGHLHSSLFRSKLKFVFHLSVFLE